MKDVSILIPTYNDACGQLVIDLQRQAEALAIGYEIIVGDDGSTDAGVVALNRRIDTQPHCRYVERPRNEGRAAIRNFLAREACYPWLLFIDSDMTVVASDFVFKYVSGTEADVVYGGIIVGGDQEKLRGNLRFLYEKASEPEHTLERRREQPYHDFHTANFLIRRELMLRHPFDERFRHYGYEDVLFGKQLRTAHISITHIDNPVGFCTFESNADFVSKTEEGMRTLHTFRSELRGYSRLITLVEGIHLPVVLSVIRLAYRMLGPAVRRQLCGRRPCLRLFNLYKLAYFVTLEDEKPFGG